MTKYILHGGRTREINSDNDSFFHEITLGFKGRISILLNYFAREDDEIERLFKRDKERFLQNSQNKEINFELAKQDEFAGQLKRADVLYVSGGTTSKLVRIMSNYPRLESSFKGKIIAGSSAGAYVLSKYYYENDIGEGLGIFNFKIFGHYTSNDRQAIQRFLNYKRDLPLLTLPEYKWVVLYK